MRQKSGRQSYRKKAGGREIGECGVKKGATKEAEFSKSFEEKD